MPGLVTERTKKRRARQPPYGSEPTHMTPRHDTKTLFPLHPSKSVLVSRPPLTRNLRNAQYRGRPTTAWAKTRYISTDFVMGADFGAKRSVHCTARLRLSMYCSPCFPLRSTLTVLDRLGDFALRISRREYCQEQKIVMISLHRPSVLPGKFHDDGLLCGTVGGRQRGG